MKKIFAKFRACYANDDIIVQFFYLNLRVLESDTAEEAGMENWAHIECFNFLNFFLSRDLAEMNSHNIYVHFALRLVDTKLLDEAVGVLWTDDTVVDIVGDDDEGNVEKIL